MSKYLLILTTEIPNPFLSDSTDFYNNSFFWIDKRRRKIISINLRDCFNYVRYKTQSYKVVTIKAATKSLKEIEKKIGVAETAKLFSGKCEVIAIINSPGGHGATAHNIVNFIEYLNNKKAKSKAYIYSHAASAACIVVSSFKKKCSFLETEFMLHTSRIPEELQEPMSISEKAINKDYISEEFADYLDVFFASALKSKHKKCEEIIDKALEKTNCDLYLSGEHLNELGIVKDISLNIKEHRSKINKELGLILDEKSHLGKLIVSLEKQFNKLEKKGKFASVNIFENKNESPFFYHLKNK